jgi:pantothenate kinase
MDDADICHAVCTMIAQNICQIVHMTARLHGLNKVFFTGNFLRHNDVAQKYGCAGLSSVRANDWFSASPGPANTYVNIVIR